MYKINFNLDEFLEGRVAILCLDEYEAGSILGFLSSQGFTWEDDGSLEVSNRWGKFERDTCYRCVRKDGRILGVNKVYFYRDVIKCKVILADQLVFNGEAPTANEFQLENFLNKRVLIHCDTEEESKAFTEVMLKVLPSVHPPAMFLPNTRYKLWSSYCHMKGKTIYLLCPYKKEEGWESYDEVVIPFKDLVVPLSVMAKWVSSDEIQIEKETI